MIMNMNPYLGFRKAVNFNSIFFFSIIQMYKKLKWKNINHASYYWISECRKWINFSLNNSRFGDFVDRIYPIELEIKDSTDTDRSASYLDLHLEIDSEGRLRTKLYDKRDDFNFPIVNFPFICSNIPAAPAYGVYISQMIQYSRACGSYQEFLEIEGCC